MSGPDLATLRVVVNTADSLAYEVEYRADGKGTTTRAFGRIKIPSLRFIYAEGSALLLLCSQEGRVSLTLADFRTTLRTLLKIAE